MGSSRRSGSWSRRRIRVGLLRLLTLRDPLVVNNTLGSDAFYLGCFLNMRFTKYSFFFMPFDRRFDAFRRKKLYQVGADDVVAEPFLLKKFEMFQRRAGIGQVLEVGRSPPVLEVG